MRIIYVSASRIPSRQANTVHVLNQVYGFVELGYKVTLFAKSNLKNKSKLEDHLKVHLGLI